MGIAVVLVLTFVVYAPTLGYLFVHDDRGQIVENPAVHSWRAVPSYFTTQVWAGVTPHELGNYYRPLFLLWLRINEVIFGNHAWGWHLTTVLAHLLVTLLVYLLACRVGTGRDVALVAALIFGLHPAHIEAVAWISGVTEPLLGILLIASFLCYMQWRLDEARKWKLLSLALFALAMLEKETALILPGLLLVYEWIFGTEWTRPGEGKNYSPALRRRVPFPQDAGLESSGGVLVPSLNWRGALGWCAQALGKIWPYFILIALYVPARIHALKGFSHVITRLSTARLLFTWPSLIEFWIRHLVWPVGLSTFYNLSVVIYPTFRNFTLPAIIILGVGLAVFAAARKSRTAAFFAVWLVLPLVPLLNLRIFLADDFAHDRYLYLPSLGFAVLVAMLLKKVCPGPPRWLGFPASFFATGLCLAAALSYGTITGSFYFKDNLTFYAYILSKTPHSPYAESNYGILLAERGEYGPALERFLDVAKYHPDYYNALYNLALTYYKVGKLPEAEQNFLRAIRINPDKPDSYFYLGMTRFKSGRTAEAIACVRQALAIQPNGYAYHFALGVMLKTQGDLTGALQEFKEELANYPGEQPAAAQVKEIGRQVTSDK
jgi:tetratricopeptide (TPR) repeat protein